MYFRRWLQQLGLFLLSIVLFGCAYTQSGSGASSDFALVKNIGKHHSYHRGPNVASDPENVATQDYYNSQSSFTAASENNSNNLWTAIRQNFKINHYQNNPNVQAQISWYVHHQGYLDRTALRAAPFMYYIYQEVKVRNLPSELVLLPIIESAYNPFVSSPAGASGLWQLVPGTARSFGVRQDWWYDGRRDISASTKAALDYFTYLQNYFGGDWLLAIAAYNAGQGTVSSAIHRNAREGLKTDFWSLRLPSQTEAYVPQLLALALIINNPQAYGVHLPPISNAPYLGQVDISSQMSLDKAAQFAGVSLTELKILNPGYKESTLSPNQPYKLLLPIDRISAFRRNLLGESNVAASGLMSHYKVQPHDSWQKIAKRFDTTVEILQAVNRNESLAPPVGMILQIPENAANQAAIAQEITQQAATISPSKPVSDSDSESAFTVAQPDLSDAAALDRPAMQASENRDTEAADEQSADERDEHKEDNKISVSSERPDLSRITHTVRRGETLYSIARSYKISAIELARWNHLSEHSRLMLGAKLTVFQKDRQEEHHEDHEDHPVDNKNRDDHKERINHTDRRDHTEHTVHSKHTENHVAHKRVTHHHREPEHRHKRER